MMSTFSPNVKNQLLKQMFADLSQENRALKDVIVEQDGYCYQSDTRRDEPVIQALTDMAEYYPQYGFKKLFQKLRRQGHVWNHCCNLNTIPVCDI